MIKKLAFLAFSFSSLLSFAQEKTYTFEDGVEVDFELLSDQSKKPAKWTVQFNAELTAFSELGGEVFDYVQGPSYIFGVEGFYQWNDDLQLKGNLNFGSGFEADENTPSLQRMGLQGFYTFAENTVKDRRGIVIGSRTTMVTANARYSTNYVIKAPVTKTRKWEVMAGINNLQHFYYENYNDLTALENLPTRFDSIHRVSVNGIAITQLEIGISYRTLRRREYTLDGAPKKNLTDSRYLLKLMLPLSTRVQGEYDYYSSNGGSFASRETEAFENGDHFGEVAKSFGFGLDYDFIQILPFWENNITMGYTAGINWYPFLEDGPAMINLGLSIGFINP